MDFFSWDDLVTSANVRSKDVRDNLAKWFAEEAETRLEPGGVGLLVGQRLGPDDLYSDRLDITYADEEGEPRRKYVHIVYPAHDDRACNGEHRQADEVGGGCLLDAKRLPWRELQANRQEDPRRYRMLYQQEDVDPAGALVDDVWLTGGTDSEGFERPGCFDEDRGFLEWPGGVSGLIDYVTADPSAGNWWGFEWWAIHPETMVRYLIRDLLQWDVERKQLTGVMEEWQARSKELRHPIRAWVLEANSAFKHLLQYDHFRKWQLKWNVPVIRHKTGLNKNDERTGVEALLPPLYRQGLKRLTRRHGDLDALNFTNALRKELTTYPEGATTDLVMADWEGEWNLRQILSLGRRETPKVEATLLRT